MQNFYITFLLIVTKFHEKTTSRSGGIKNLCPEGGEGVDSHPLPHLLKKEVLSEKQSLYNTFKLTKWMGIFQVGIFWVKISRGLGGGSNLTGKSLTGGNFPEKFS